MYKRNIVLESFEKLLQNFIKVKPTSHQAFYCKNVMIYLIPQMFASGVILVQVQVWQQMVWRDKLIHFP